MYTEDKTASLPYRRWILKETAAYLNKLRAEADDVRRASFKPDFSSVEAYTESMKDYRRKFYEMLGKPLTDYPKEIPENYERIHLAEDQYGNIDRLWVEVAPGLFSYGLLFTPKGDEPSPFVMALHGGIGTCEHVSSIMPSTNYNEMVQRVRAKARVTVYAPQLIMWGDACNEVKSDASEQHDWDYRFKQVGSSMAAFEIFKMMRAVDWICANCAIDQERMGILGLSYGGFYTLFTSACDTRYRVALSSGQFNNRYNYPYYDWTWFNSGAKFMDAEVAAMVCPRALIVQVGRKDELFSCDPAIPVAEEVKETYAKLGLSENFSFRIHEGTHEFAKEDDDLDLFIKKLLA